jgi:hypothetical protein
MFKLVKDPVSKWPVRWNSVSPEGELVEQTLKLKLARCGRKAFNRIFNAPGEVTPEEELENFLSVVKDWEDVVDADGAPVPFSREAAAELLDMPGFALAFTLAYIAFFQGQAQEREKNSVPSPAGPAAAAPRTGAAAAASESV